MGVHSTGHDSSMGRLQTQASRGTRARRPGIARRDRSPRVMFREWANKIYGASNAPSSAPNARARGRDGGKTSDGKSTSASATVEPRTFADRWMMSWTDEDVTFLGEDPYGDCAGNVFATVAADEQRRRASVDETRRASADGGSRRTSENGDDFEKASAFWRIGPL